MVQIVKVVYGIDKGYFLPALVSLYSLCKNTGSNVDATIYMEGLDDISYQTKAEAIAQDVGIPAPTIAPFDAPGLKEYAGLTKNGVSNRQSLATAPPEH